VQNNSNMPARAVARGFTLVELLVVIGIIVILISILVPLATRVQQSARVADSAAQLNSIRSAIEAYHGTFNAYPGPVPNDGVVGALTITGSENLVLGLFGGLQRSGKVISFNPDRVGTGPRTLLYGDDRDKSYSFLDNWPSHLPPKADWSAQNRWGTPVPEFVDRYAYKPVLYLRAKRGAAGIAGENAGDSVQYSRNQIREYTRIQSNPDHNRHSSGRYGLDTLDGDQVSHTGPASFRPYLRNPSSINDPRAKDTFILISVGRDRLYGTADDITSFGSVMP
jgi:prepilin-type N-terminal cleavage/methylation domain-containing protein